MEWVARRGQPTDFGAASGPQRFPLVEDTGAFSKDFCQQGLPRPADLTDVAEVHLNGPGRAALAHRLFKFATDSSLSPQSGSWSRRPSVFL
jgi:hypothetical protein